MPRPPTAWASRPPPFARRLLFVPFVPAPVFRCAEVNGRGNGEGSSSTESECGLRNGPEVMGPDVMEDMPPPGVPDASGVGGGDVPPSLLRNLRVICGRDCESSVASETTGEL